MDERLEMAQKSWGLMRYAELNDTINKMDQDLLTAFHQPPYTPQMKLELQINK